MISLNSLVTVILEANTLYCPRVVGRTYADDISGALVATAREDLLQQIRHFHRIIKTLESTGFGEISSKKSFTFGVNALNSSVDPAFTHQHAFRFVGGSFVTADASASDSQVEQSRLAKWAKTVVQMRHSPHPWRVKSRMLLATQSQATFAQGAHSFQLDLNLLKKVRSSVVRCLWSSDFHVYQGFRAILRCMQQQAFANCLQSRYSSNESNFHDGPTLRLRSFGRQGPFMKTFGDAIDVRCRSQ